MMITDTQLTWILWSAGTGSLGLLCFGLFRQKKRLPPEMQGEVILGDRPLHAGQQGQIARLADGKETGEALTIFLQKPEKGLLPLRLEAPRIRAEEAQETRGRDWRPGDSVLVTVTGETSLYQFATRLQGVRPGTYAGEWILTVRRPRWLLSVQRRKHRRANLRLPLSIQTGSGERDLSAPLSGMLLDISTGGLRAMIGGTMGAPESAALQERLAPGTPVHIRVPMPGMANALLARIQTCERITQRGGLGIRISGVFLPMETWEEEMLHSLVAYAYRDRPESSAETAA